MIKNKNVSISAYFITFGLDFEGQKLRPGEVEAGHSISCEQLTVTGGHRLM